MDFGALPPEINSARIYSGPGSRPLMQAAAAWQRLANELTATAASYSSVISGSPAMTGWARRHCRWRPRPSPMSRG